MKRVLVVPRNGYLNRLQAMASASILASEFGIACEVCWLPQEAAPSPQEVIFGAASGVQFIPAEELEQTLGFSLSDFPRYVNSHNVSGVGRVVTLAGHDLGEQPLMSTLAGELDSDNSVIIVIVAGGRFLIGPGNQSVRWDSEDFRALRRAFYQSVEFAPEIEGPWPSLVREPFIGVHLRYSDRSHQTPSRSEIKRSVMRLVTNTGIRRVFVASDTRKERDYWVQLLSSLGVTPWIFESDAKTEFSRDTSALIEWRILTQAQAIVYFAESSFGYEAAVASGHFDQGVALVPNKFISLKVQARDLAQKIFGTPKRRGWL